MFVAIEGAEGEVVLPGTVSGRYWSAAWPGGAQSDVVFTPGNFLVPVGCAGRAAPNVHQGVKQFDFNGDGGATYNQTVLLEQASEFSITEEVRGLYNTLLFSRNVAVVPPYHVQVWECDDGGECPKPASQWFPPFSISYTFNTLQPGRLSGLQARGSVDAWKSALGITNENDLMGAWSFSNWADVQSLNGLTSYSGSHVAVKLLNTGVTASSIPNL